MAEKDKLHLEGLRDRLLEDADSPEDADAWMSVANHLQAWSSPEATPQMTAQLIEQLLPNIPNRETALKRAVRQVGEWWPLLLMRTQVRVVRREIWAASALVMALGTLVTLGTYNPESGVNSPMVILAPVVAAVGVALLYDSEYEQMLEIENTTSASARMLLLARLLLVFGFNLVLGLIGSVSLTIFHADISLWPLVMSWLAPMAFLSGIAFLLSIAFGDALVGSTCGLIIWGLHVLLRTIPDSNRFIMVLSLPGLAAPESRPLLFVTAGLLVALALWLVGQQERRTGDGI